MVFRTRSGGSSSATAWAAPATDLLIFTVGSSNPLTRAPTAGRLVAAGKFDEEDFVIADIDLSRTREVRSRSHHFSARNPELYRAIAEPTPFP